MPFFQTEIPNISLFLTLQQSQKNINTEYWPFATCLIRSQTIQNNYYIVYPSKNGMVHILHFENDSLQTKRSIKIPFSIHHKITTISCQTLKNPKPELNKATLPHLLFGYENNAIEIYAFYQAQNDVELTLIKIQQIILKVDRKQPVLNIKIYAKLVIVGLAYQIAFIEGVIEKKDNKIVEHRMKFKQQPMNKINIDINRKRNLLYVYNDQDGIVVYDLKTMKQFAKIIDSVRMMAPIDCFIGPEGIAIVVTSMDNSIKIIDYSSNIVKKYVGFKNYVNCCHIDIENQLLWVGCLDGSIACFLFKSDNENGKDTKMPQMVLIQKKLKYRMKICENGISNIFVFGNLMLMKDCQHNFYVYDIIKGPLSDMRTLTSNYTQITHRNTTE